MTRNQKLTLKEIFLREEVNESDSTFLKSIRIQLSRAKDQATLDYIADAYDKILKLVFVEDPQQRQQVLQNEEPFFKFHFRKAYNDMRNGIITPEAVQSLPTGKEMVESELNKRRAREAEETAPTPKPALPTQDDRNEAEVRAAYGGDPNKRPWGLGS